MQERQFDKTSTRLTPQGQIIHHIRSAIQDGTLKPGDKISLREELERFFEVTPVTVQRAFTRLRDDGFVVARGRSGTYVAPNPPNLFRTALLYDVDKERALSLKFTLAIATAAARAEQYGGQSLISYYGIAEPDGDRERLLADLSAGRLAGLIWACAPGFVPDDDRLTAPDIPAVFLSYADPAFQVSLIELDGFLDKAASEIVRLGGRRTAVLYLAAIAGTANDGGGPNVVSRTLEQVRQFQAGTLATLQAAGLSSRPEWIQAAGRDCPGWVLPLLQALFAAPLDQRPDSLIVADDHLADFALEALLELGLWQEVRTVFHTNFPLVSSLPAPAVRVGYDCGEVLGAALALLERQRAGEAAPMSALVPARSEFEVRTVDGGKAEVAPFVPLTRSAASGGGMRS